MRCQRCQRGGFNSLDFCAVCLRSLCVGCFHDGCCTHTPALSGQHYDRRGQPKPVLQDERDEDGDMVMDPTPTVPVDPSCVFRDIGGES